jgi:hypothetical protein
MRHESIGSRNKGIVQRHFLQQFETSGLLACRNIQRNPSIVSSKIPYYDQPNMSARFEDL